MMAWQKYARAGYCEAECLGSSGWYGCDHRARYTITRQALVDEEKRRVCGVHKNQALRQGGGWKVES